MAARNSVIICLLEREKEEGVGQGCFQRLYRCFYSGKQNLNPDSAM